MPTASWHGADADTFTYSARGELLSATVGAQTTTYAYDGYGRRVAQYQRDGHDPIPVWQPRNMLQVTATRIPGGVLSTYYYDAQGSLYAMERAGSRFYITTDQLGYTAVSAITASVTVKTLDIRQLGQHHADSAPPSISPSATRVVCGCVSGLVRFGFRDYEPAPAAGRRATRCCSRVGKPTCTLTSAIARSRSAMWPDLHWPDSQLRRPWRRQSDDRAEWLHCLRRSWRRLGGGLELNPLEDAGRTGWSEKAELTGQIGPLGGGGGIKLDDCGNITPYVKAKVGPVSLDTKKGLTIKASPMSSTRTSRIYGSQPKRRSKARYPPKAASTS